MPGEGRVRVWVTRFTDRVALQLQWIDPESGRKRTRSARTTDEQEAERARGDLEYELNHGLHARPSRVSWETFRSRFESEYLSGLRHNTRRGYRQTFDSFERLCGEVRPSSLTARTLSGFVGALRREGVAPSTIALRLSHLRAALAWGVRQGFLGEVPPLPEVKVPRRRPRPVSDDDVAALLAGARAEGPELLAFCAAAWYAGLRPGEAAELRRVRSDTRPWVDRQARRVWLPAEFVKGCEDQWVPLDPALAEALDAVPDPGDGRVFPFGGLKPNAIAERVRRLAARLGVPVTMRTLRRGFGCRYAARVPAQVLQRLMRHSSITTTMTYYANVDAATERAVFGDGNSDGNSSGVTGADV